MIETTQHNTSRLDSGLACLVMLGQYFGKPMDAGQIRHRHGSSEPLLANDILRYALEAGFKARKVSTSLDRLDHTPLPAIALDQNGDFFILAKIVDDHVLIQSPAIGRPETLNRAAFAERWTGELILLATRAQLTLEGAHFDLSWFIPAVIKYRRLFGEVLVASFFLQFFSLASPLFIQVIFDKVLIHRGLTSLDVVMMALIVVSMFEVLMSGLRTWLFSHTTNRIDVELGAKLYRHLLGLPIAYHKARRVGETVARVKELETIRTFLTGSALTLILDLAFTIVFFAVMFAYAPQLAWIVAGSLPIYVAIVMAVNPVLHRRIEEKFRRGAENQAFLVETITGVETLKSLAVEPQMQRRWEEQLAAYVQAAFKAGHLSNWASQAVQLVQKLTTALTLYFGALLVMDNALTLGQLIAFNMLAGRVASPILRLSQLAQDFQQMKIAVARLGDILNTKPEGVGTGKAALPAIQGQIKLEKVVFRYRPDGPAIVKNLSLTIPAGQMVGVVGLSGSGKSTLARLIQRFYSPEAGRVMIDGFDLALADPSWLRRQIGMVLQDNYLLNQSIRDTIALADPALPLNHVMAAAKLAGAHDFILDLPEGYDTVIGERGSILSGGQRQRLAIARALVTNPKIIIFDEATSALDYESERVVQDNMRRIGRGRTVIIIAHRLSTIRDCDRILTLEAGEIVEDGTHDALLRAGGRYAALWACQAA